MIALKDFADAYGCILLDAVLKAHSLGFTLNTYSDPIAEGRLDASTDYAARTAEVDPSLVYLTGVAPLGHIDDEAWSRVCGHQSRAVFLRHVIDCGQTIEDGWAEACKHAEGL